MPDLFPKDLPIVLWQTSIPQSTFFIIGVIVAVIVFVKEYLDLTVHSLQYYTRIVIPAFVVGAYVFVYLCVDISNQLLDAAQKDATLQLVRSSLLFGALFMIIGPLLLLSPVKKIYVTSRIGRAIVGAAHKKETRYTAFGLFLLVCIAQLTVIYSLGLVLYRVFNLEIVDVMGTCVCYLLLVAFYLVAFYSSMMEKTISLRGIKPLEVVREKLQFLDTIWYLRFYIFIYSIQMLGSLGVTIFWFVQDVNTKKKSGSSLIVASVFFGLSVIAILAFAVFLLVEAFRVKKVEVEEFQVKKVDKTVDDMENDMENGIEGDFSDDEDEEDVESYGKEDAATKESKLIDGDAISLDMTYDGNRTEDVDERRGAIMPRQKEDVRHDIPMDEPVEREKSPDMRHHFNTATPHQQQQHIPGASLQQQVGTRDIFDSTIPMSRFERGAALHQQVGMTSQVLPSDEKDSSKKMEENVTPKGKEDLGKRKSRRRKEANAIDSKKSKKSKKSASNSDESKSSASKLTPPPTQSQAQPSPVPPETIGGLSDQVTPQGDTMENEADELSVMLNEISKLEDMSVNLRSELESQNKVMDDIHDDAKKAKRDKKEKEGGGGFFGKKKKLSKTAAISPTLPLSPPPSSLSPPPLSLSLQRPMKPQPPPSSMSSTPPPAPKLAQTNKPMRNSGPGNAPTLSKAALARERAKKGGKETTISKELEELSRGKQKERSWAYDRRSLIHDELEEDDALDNISAMEEAKIEEEEEEYIVRESKFPIFDMTGGGSRKPVYKMVGMHNWTVEETQDWLQDTELMFASKLFRKHHINGKKLKEATVRSLMKLGFSEQQAQNIVEQRDAYLRQHL
eukprot:m.47463 g.47463  ORF g.47463 m.47463 type:complete len:847 (-) comp7332_c0_seq4:1325-3865(-)